MTKQDVGSLALRLMGIYILAQTILALPMITPIFGEAKSAASSDIGIRWSLLVASQIVPFLVVLAGASALVLRSHSLAGRLFDDADARAFTRPNGRDLQMIGLSLIGMSVLAHALPHFTRLGMLASMDGDSLIGGLLRREYRAGAAELIVELLIGVGLFWGARGIANMWWRLRGLGTPQ
jgi:hypothetical protein